MGEIVAAIGTCHTPYMFTRPPDENPQQLDQAGAGMRELGKVLDETKPDAILFFGADHVETFSVTCVPSFAIVAGDRAIREVDSRAGDVSHLGDAAGRLGFLVVGFDAGLLPDRDGLRMQRGLARVELLNEFLDAILVVAPHIDLALAGADLAHVLEQRLWRANLEIAFGFFASRFGSVSGTENRRPGGQRKDEQKDKFLFHSGRLITQHGRQGHLF
jgi:hypothetical protein